MIHIKKIIPCIPFIIQIVFTQGGWQWQDPLPTGNTYSDVQFIDSLNGWVGGDGGSVLHTEDGGITWEVQWVGVSIYIKDLFFTDINNGWVVGEEPFGGPTYILHTDNGGMTWIVQYENDSYYRNNAIDFVDNIHGWVIRENAPIFHTIDGGLNWYEQPIPHLPTVKGIDFVDDDHGWAVGNNEQIFMTHDGGDNWESITLPDSLMTGSSWRRITFIDTLKGWLIGGSILKTNDGGMTWNKQWEQATNITDVSIVNDEVVWASLYSGRMLKTVDGGETWSIIETANSYPLHSADFITPNYGWTVGSFATLLSTTTGGIGWTNHTTMIGDILTLLHYSVDFIDENNGWISGINGSIYHTADGGLTWEEQVSGTDEDLRAIQFINSQKGWVAGSNGTILKTVDGGNNWLERSPDISLSFKDVHFINEQTGWIAGGDYFEGGIVLRTDDGGDSWRVQIGDSIPDLDEVMFLDSLQGYVIGASETNFMMKTSDGGQTWESSTLPGGPSHFRGFFLDSITGWIVNEFGYVYHTSDAGQTWVLRAIEPSGSDIIFIDENTGWVSSLVGIIYHTEDGGWTWTRQPSLTGNWLMSIDFINSQTGWVVGALAILNTTTGGELKTDGESEINPINPKTFTLYQNYPNPFNAYTLIPVNITVSNTKVHLGIYNLTGELIALLFAGELSAGQYTFYWNGRNGYGQQASSGIYFIRFANEFNMHTIKTIYVK